MGRFFITALAGAIALGMAGSAAQADTVLGVWNLNDHPDGAQNPPPYGLRFDNMFLNSGGNGGVTTFSFDTYNDTTLTVTQLNDLSLRIDIVGTVYGGEVDSGFGLGTYDLSFAYNLGINVDGTGYDVIVPDNSNTGTLTAQSGTPFVGNSDTFSFGDQADSNGHSFLMLQDGHRLNQVQKDQFGGDPWVGRGWFYYPGNAGYQDFLFVATSATIIPLPSSVGLGVAAGFAGLYVSRRRR